MAKVQVIDTPSQQVIKAAATEYTVKDARGRDITLRDPGVAIEYEIVEVVGGDAAKNEVYMSMVMPLFFVSSIDSQPVTQPSTKREIKALIQRLDRDGINAVMNGIKEHFGAVDAEAQKESIKK